MHSRKELGIDRIDSVELFRPVTCHKMQIGLPTIGLCGSASTSVNVLISTSLHDFLESSQARRHASILSFVTCGCNTLCKERWPLTAPKA